MEITAIKCGKMIDGTGKPAVENATIIIEGSKIKSAGQNLPVPEGAKVIDASKNTVMPGLIDSHMHFWGALTDGHFANIMRPSELQLLKSIYDAQKMLAAGYTTTKDCGSTHAVYMKHSADEGVLKGVPRIIASGLVLSQTAGHGDAEHMPVECVDYRTTRHSGSYTLICDGVDECIKATRYAIRFGADYIKLMGTDGLKGDLQFNPEEISAVVKAAAQAGKYVTAHCGSLVAARHSILAGVKTIDHAGPMNAEIIDLANERGVLFVTTMSLFKAMLDHPGAVIPPEWVRSKIDPAKVWEGALEHSAMSYKQLHQMGALLALGTDFEGSPSRPLGDNALELELMVEHNVMTPMDAIVSATRNGAKACFIGDKTGTIESGKFADIIVVDGDPLRDIKTLRDINKIKMVMLEGKVEKNIMALVG